MENLMMTFLRFFQSEILTIFGKQLFEKSNKNLTAERIEVIQTQIERSTSSLSLEKINEKKFKKKIFFEKEGGTLHHFFQSQRPEAPEMYLS